jgi:DNA-binding MarR family transcriptional regulator
MVTRATDPDTGCDTVPDEALAFVGEAVDQTVGRLPTIDREAMELVLLLHRVTNSIVYDLESTVHRPAGWSWSAFRAVFTLWISGPLEPSRLAARTGMSRQAVSALTKTLENDGLIARATAAHDARSVVLSLTPAGTERIERVFVDHNRREADWAGILAPGERGELVRMLAKLADAAHDPWVNHRSRTVAGRDPSRRGTDRDITDRDATDRDSHGDESREPAA